MDAFTYSHARQNLSHLLDIAVRMGEARIRRRDGSSFIIRPEKSTKSPLAVRGIRTRGINMQGILAAIRESRKEY